MELERISFLGAKIKISKLSSVYLRSLIFFLLSLIKHHCNYANNVTICIGNPTGIFQTYHQPAH